MSPAMIQHQANCSKCLIYRLRMDTFTKLELGSGGGLKNTFRSVIPELWPAGHFWPAASYKMARQDLWSRIFYLHHISV